MRIDAVATGNSAITTLVDSNMLLRGAQLTHPQFLVTDNAVAKLRGRGDIVYACPQNCTEFWAVATRPLSANGLGFTTAEAEVQLAKIEYLFPLLPDSPAIYTEWRRLVTLAGVSGKPTHDARLMAVAIVHGMDNLLTFNTSDFVRFAPFAPGVTILDPNTV
jgi:predicted nucleic acid-binding protein